MFNQNIAGLLTRRCITASNDFGQGKFDCSVIICVQDGSPLVSTVDIQPVYNSQADVYSQHSTSVELDVTVPPWSGTEQLNISFYSIPLTTTAAIHKWRLCRVCI